MSVMQTGLVVVLALLVGCPDESNPATDTGADAGDAAVADRGAADAAPPDLAGAADGPGASDSSDFTPIPGVHTPLPIDPTVSIPDNHWLLDLYRVVLDREHDAAGYKVNRKALEAGNAGRAGNLRNADGSGSGITWAQLMDAFYAAPEYKTANCHTSPGLRARRQPDLAVEEIVQEQRPVPSCTSPWDCNNRDKQDWKREGR
jgi:hypothetical protein